MNYVEQFDILGTTARVRDADAQTDINALKNNVVAINGEIADIDSKIGEIETKIEGTSNQKRHFLIIGDEYGLGTYGWVTMLKPRLENFGYGCTAVAVAGLKISGLADVVKDYQSSDVITDILVCVGKNDLETSETEISQAFSSFNSSAKNIRYDIKIYVGCLDFQTTETYRKNAPKQRKIIERCCANYGFDFMQTLSAVLPAMNWQGLTVFITGNATISNTSGSYLCAFLTTYVRYGKAIPILPYNITVYDSIGGEFALNLNIVGDMLEVSPHSGIYNFSNVGEWISNDPNPHKFGGALYNANKQEIIMCDCYLGMVCGELVDGETDFILSYGYGLYIIDNTLAFMNNKQNYDDVSVSSEDIQLFVGKNNSLYIPLMNI